MLILISHDYNNLQHRILHWSHTIIAYQNVWFWKPLNATTNDISSELDHTTLEA